MGALRALRELGVSFAQADVLVLCYHAVRTRERFAAQLSGLAARGYSVLSMQHFTEWLRGTTSVRTPAALLTFDGGYAEQLDNAVPVLERLGFPATFFLISSDLEADGPGIRRRDVAALTAAGHTVGCHSHTHPDLTRLPDDELEREVLGSKRRLEQALGHRVGAFCYPDGAHDARVVAAVRRAGFDVAFTVDLGGVRRGDDPYRLRRVPVLGEPGSGEFFAYLAGRRIVSGTIALSWKLRERFWDHRDATRGRADLVHRSGGVMDRGRASPGVMT
jgi:peptidoglycan/xylan/chitin deacetylase (PgdA/CDA1 family)